MPKRLLLVQLVQLVQLVVKALVSGMHDEASGAPRCVSSLIR